MVCWFTKMEGLDVQTVNHPCSFTADCSFTEWIVPLRNGWFLYGMDCFLTEWMVPLRKGLLLSSPVRPVLGKARYSLLTQCKGFLWKWASQTRQWRKSGFSPPCRFKEMTRLSMASIDLWKPNKIHRTEPINYCCLRLSTCRGMVKSEKSLVFIRTTWAPMNVLQTKWVALYVMR